ncbi:MAG: PmoA family protein [Planctomycetota bacterium]
MNRFANSLACLLMAGPAASAQADENHTPQFTIQQNHEENREEVLINGALFVGYNTADTPKPYLYPIIGPTGANMTRHFPMRQGVEGEKSDHLHHTSLWFAHGSLNGTDFWHIGRNNSGTIQTVTDVGSRQAAPSASIGASALWLDPQRTPIADADTAYGFSVLADGSRVIDYKTRITPADGVERVVFGDTKEGTMAIRVHPALRLKGDVATGQCINSNGQTNDDCWGKRAAWVAYWGEIDGATCGIAVFDHPANLRHPSWWHARDYGLVASNPFGVSDFERRRPRGDGEYTLEAGQALELSYRFVFFAGTAEEADIAGKYAAWVRETAKAAEETTDEQ